VLILAGDIASGLGGVYWAAGFLGRVKKVIMIAGNHEFYGYQFPSLYEGLKEKANELGVIFLQDDTVTIDGWNFIGSTLWTDYKFGQPNAEVGKIQIMNALNDFSVIRGAHPDKFESANVKSRAYISDQLKNLGREKSIVVTHHAPVSASVHPIFEYDRYNAGFINGWDDWVSEEGPAVWVHGHIHAQMDNMVGKTRVVANPRAYGDEHKKYGDPPFTFKSIEV
jgi:Icc-related predicted phosphoesterase